MLFRTEAIQHARHKQDSTIIIHTPFDFIGLTAVVIFFVVLMLVFIIHTDWSEYITVRGYVTSDHGVTAVYSKNNGVVLACYAGLGDVVHLGDPLCLIANSPLAVDEVMQAMQVREQHIKHLIALKKKKLHQLQRLHANRYITTQEVDVQQQALDSLYTQRHALSVEQRSYQQQQSYLISAPITGRVSAVFKEVGQTVMG